MRLLHRALVLSTAWFVVRALPDPDLMWRIVATSSTFAGNLLLIGVVLLLA